MFVRPVASEKLKRTLTYARAFTCMPFAEMTLHPIEQSPGCGDQSCAV